MPEEEAAATEVEAGSVEATPDLTASIPEWRAGLPAEVRDLEMITKFDAADNPFHSLVNGFIGAEKALGADKVVVPGRDASDEDRRAFYTAIGCPEDLDGYTAPTENISEGFNVDLFNDLRVEAHRLGVSAQAYAGLSRALDARQREADTEAIESHNRQVGEWEEQLKKSWGEAFEQNMLLANHVVSSFGGEPLMELIKNSGIGSHPVFLEALAKMGKSIAEDEIVGGGGAQSFAKTPEMAESEWEALQLDEGFMKALKDQNDPAHKAAVERQTKLFQQMHPGE
jgi:hypothetical protein